MMSPEGKSADPLQGIDMSNMNMSETNKKPENKSKPVETFFW